MIEPHTDGSRADHFREYLTMTAKLWGKHISGPIMALIAIASVIAAAFLRNDATFAAKVVVWTAWLTALATILLLFRAQYDAWAEIHQKLDVERAKNEAAPKIDMGVMNVIPRGAIGRGLTDLFLYVRLVLGEPSQVTIRDFSLTIFDESQSLSFTAIDDVGEWEVVKKREITGDIFSVRCVPLAKQLTTRGDPVQGWIHFPVSNLVESFVYRRTLTLEVNSAHGTCYFNFAGTDALPDPDAKGTIRKIT